MANLFLVALSAFLSGVFLGGLMTFRGMRHFAQANMMSVTRLLFVAIPFSALSWVFISYAIAIYSTVKLGQVYTMSELSGPAITGIVAVLFAKVLENVFEHNDGPIFGHNIHGKDEAA